MSIMKPLQSSNDDAARMWQYFMAMDRCTMQWGQGHPLSSAYDRLVAAVQRIGDAHPERVGRPSKTKGPSRLMTALLVNAEVSPDPGVRLREVAHFFQHAPLADIDALMVSGAADQEVMGEQVLNAAMSYGRKDVVARMIRRLGRAHVGHLARSEVVVGDDTCLDALLSVHDADSLNKKTGSCDYWMQFMRAWVPMERFLTVVYPKLHAAGAKLMASGTVGLGVDDQIWRIVSTVATSQAVQALDLYRHQVLVAELRAVADEAAPAPADQTRARRRL
ncbi:hypothetical protein BBJ41_01065 [Burkholderia stabilis]|uniref:hypothetical protein n=1 Tax=Burkholderiaceae TaxID=119060 RepID=UPI000851C291|nr:MULTISPECIES: hypothetical protein [Burkholderiaceae]AOR66255.1 hypothetical protein BBJ41_01065 [Burkholderia stabilis]MBU7436091.1 hypothetical protein [Paraburkholderia fungorum]HDR9491936.1 hypothetical protein [Burkholderia stabilis]HDR9524030.1 hypothetical protein [Burkholderia stabilis]HDR9530663.1 hypothetical protein [Burkholderia stabilis]